MCPAAFSSGGDQRPTRLCVVGSVNMDQFFTVVALPRPGETVLASSTTTAPGGKGGNQAVAAARAGAIVQFVGAIGADAAGAQLRGHLLDNGVGLDGVEALTQSLQDTAAAIKRGSAAAPAPTPRISTKDEYDKLEKGTIYISAKDGQRYEKQ